MRAICLALALAAGCGPSSHDLQIVPSLNDPSCVPATPVTEVRVAGLGDFPLDGASVGAASQGGLGHLTLPLGTRVISVEGLAPGGLEAFGRTGTIDPAMLGPAVAIAYGPPDALCATTGAMLSARSGHRATLLPSGNVLISGGVNSDGFAVTSLELYVPGGDELTAPATFRLTDPRGASALPATAVMGHAVAVFGAGDFVVTGGAPALAGVASGVADAGLQHYSADGIADGPLLHLDGGARAFHSATTLADGRVLLAGGCDVLDAGACETGRELDTVEIYDPLLGTFSAGFKLKHARWDHDAILRGDGSVLIIGGRGAEGLQPPVEIYDPVEDRGVDAGSSNGRAALLATGGVLFAGGSTAPSAHSGVWLSLTEEIDLAPLPVAATGQTVTALEDGTVLVAGGLVAGAGAPLTLYDGLGRPQPLAPPFARRDHTATRLLDGTVLLAGGFNGSNAVAAASIYFRSPLGPYSSLPTLVLDAPSPQYQPRDGEHASVSQGRLALASAQAGEGGRPGEFALVSGARLDGLTFELAAGRSGAAAAALVFGFASEASYAFVTLEPGRAVTLSTVSAPRVGQSVVTPDPGCVGVLLADGELPDGATAPLTLSWRLGTLDVSTPDRALLHCTPAAPIARGAAGVGSLHGTATFEGLTLTR